MMTPEDRFQSLKPLCAGVDDDVLRDFVTRMDPDYFDLFTPDEIAHHIRLAAQLDLDHPCQVAVTDRADGVLDVAVVAYDYFSEFATLCGLLSAYGLDIREGRIYTFAEGPVQGVLVKPVSPFHRPPRGRAGLSRKKIVDVFRVRPIPAMPFGPSERRRFVQELDGLIRLLDANRVQDARTRVNRKLVETLGNSRAAFTGLLQPVEIRFDNVLSATDTIMDIRSIDTPAFLYAFANALTMRNVYIHKARIENVGTEVHDRFHVRGRHGQKIETSEEQQELRLTAVLIKQFTHFLASAPDPAKALDHFDRFLDRILEEAQAGKALKFLQSKKTLASLSRLLGTSDFLWEDFLRRQHANLLPVLDDYQRHPLIRRRAEMTRELRRRLATTRTDAQRRRALNQYKDRELFRIDMRHLLDPSTTLPDFSRGLTELAEAVLEETVRQCQSTVGRLYGRPLLASGAVCPFALFGMGKFGGRELGYASDIELLFVYGGAGRTSGRQRLDNSEYFERLVQEILQWIEAKQEGIFHLDVRLRPHGGKSLLANTLEELRGYYGPGGLSLPFERQALIKLRFTVGDHKLGREVEAFRNSVVYGGQPWDLKAALELRWQQVKELVDLDRINVKYSPGALIDVEYAVQYLQLMHGHRHTSVQTPNTLEALEALGKAGILKSDEVSRLREAYLFFRTLIDGLRIVRGNAKDLVLPPQDSDAFVFLARRIGYATEDWQAGAAALAADLTRHLTVVRELFSDKFGRI